MSTNLLGGLTLKLVNGTTAESEGTWHHAARTEADGHKDWLIWYLPDQAALETNQTYHVGLSTRGASANDTSLHATIGYKDAAGNVNWANSDPLPIGTSWGRAEATIVVPSGMTPFGLYVAAYGTCPETWMTAAILSYGSPVTLAMAQASAANVDDGKSPTVAVSKSGTVTTITVHNADGSTTTQKVNDGTNGTPGAKGADGKTTYLHVKYSNDNGATFTANSGETVGTYIGTCTDFNSADPTTVSSYKWARIKGDTGAKGDPGAKGETGATGVGVKGTTVTYQSSSSGTTIPTGTWSSGIPSVPEGSFLWTRIVYSYSNGTSTTAYSVGKMGAKGDKGATGNTGAPGAAGRGIKSSSVTYQVGNSQTTVPTGSWATSVPKLSSTTPYLWTRTILTYTDNTTSTAYSVGTTLDGVNVGGRNLISNKIDNWQTGNWDVSNGTYTTYNGRICTKSGIAVSPNAVYYIGLFLNGLGGKQVLVRTYDNTGAYNGSYTNVANKVFVVPDNVYEMRFVIYEQVTLNDISEGHIRIKLELGNIATDWTPAPEDVATDIADAANTAANALEKANNNEKNITEATKAILDIQENIKALVTGPNGSSLMTQTNKGWTFDMSSIERTLNEATDDITNLNSDLSATNNILNSTKKLLDDVTKKTAYINFATDDSGNPCIELGKQDNPFKLRITNTSIDFMQGSQKIAYLTNHQLYIESSVITDSILIGQNGTFIWKKRANNHLGLRYT